MSKPATANPTSAGRVSKNAAAQMAGRILYLATRVGLPPFILHHISMEEYGIWATCFLIIGYVGMGAFGVANVYIRYVAEYNATNRREAIGPLLGAGLSITLVFSAAALLGLWLALPWLFAAFKIAPTLQPTAAMLILGTVATMLLDMTFGAFAYVLQGLQRITEQTLVWIASYLLETALIVVFLMEGFGVEGLLWAFAGRYVFATLVYVALCYRAIPGLKIRLGENRRETFRLFFRYGGIMQVNGLLSIFLYSCERMVAGTLTGVTSMVLLDIGQKFPMMSSQVFSSANNSFLTALTHLETQGLREEVVKLYLRGSRYLNLLNGCAMGFMAAFAAAIITGWMGVNPQYEDSAMILVCAAVGYQCHAQTGPATTYFQSTGKPERVLWGFILPQLVLLGVALATCFPLFGENLMSVVYAAVAARLLSSVLFLLYTNSQIGVGQWSYAKQVLLPGTAPYAVGFGLASAGQDLLQSLSPERLVILPALAGFGSVYGILVFAVLFTLFCQADERLAIGRLFGRLNLRRRAG
jgi:O-antigen/teichoic acid export membrane protein